MKNSRYLQLIIMQLMFFCATYPVSGFSQGADSSLGTSSCDNFDSRDLNSNLVIFHNNSSANFTINRLSFVPDYSSKRPDEIVSHASVFLGLKQSKTYFIDSDCAYIQDLKVNYSFKNQTRDKVIKCNTGTSNLIEFPNINRILKVSTNELLSNDSIKCK